MDRIPLALDPNMLDYIVKVLQQRPWQEVNSVLIEVSRQVQAANETPHFHPPAHAGNGELPEALS